jgi:hypothetical protein
MIESDSQVLDPQYVILGEAAVLQLTRDVSIELTAIDQTFGIDISFGGIESPTIAPVALIRLAELEDNGGEVAGLKGATLTFTRTAKAWEIANYKRKPMPGGQGEIMLILADGDV